MREIFSITKAAILILIASTPVIAWAGSGYIYDADGSVFIARGKDVPRPAAVRDAVSSGTLIRTGDGGHAVLKFEDGQVVSLQANSTLLVREYIYDPQQAKKSHIVFSMLGGGMRFVTGQIAHLNPKAFRLATPNATVSVQGTEFLVVIVNNATYSQVISGSIRMTNAAGSTVLTAGQTALTSSASILVKRVPASFVPVGTFGPINAIPVPAAVPETVPLSANDVLTGSVTAATGSATPSVGTAAAPIAVVEQAPAGTVDAVPRVNSQAAASETTRPASAEAASPDGTSSVAAAPVVAAPIAVSKPVAAAPAVTAPDTSSGFYVGVQLGGVKYGYSNITNNSQVGYGLLAGYAFNENFSLEAEYNSLGGFDSAKSTLKGTSVGLSGVGYYALSQQFALFGKLGYASTSMKETAKPGFIGDFTHNNSGVAGGLGVQYNINPSVGMRVGINISPVGDAASGQSTAGLAYVGGVFKF